MLFDLSAPGACLTCPRVKAVHPEDPHLAHQTLSEPSSVLPLPTNRVKLFTCWRLLSGLQPVQNRIALVTFLRLDSPSSSSCRSSFQRPAEFPGDVERCHNQSVCDFSLPRESERSKVFTAKRSIIHLSLNIAHRQRMSDLKMTDVKISSTNHRCKRCYGCCLKHSLKIISV